MDQSLNRGREGPRQPSQSGEPPSEDEIAPGRSSSLGLSTLGLALGPVLTMVDSSVVNVALASIARSFGTSLGTTQWIASAYLLAAAVALPATSYLARRIGSNRAYLLSLIAFTVASTLCALSPNVETLVALRVLQGAAGAPLVPLTIARFLGGEFSRGRRSIPIAVQLVGGLVFFLAPALGPTLGGVLIDMLGWEWIFWINVPIGALGIASAAKFLDHETVDRSASLDLVGFLLVGLGSALALYGAENGSQSGWFGPDSLPFWLAGAVLLAGFVWRSLSVARPVLDLRLLESSLAACGSAVAALASVVVYAMLILVPTYLQIQAGLSPIDAGLVLLPQGVASGVGITLGAVSATRIGLRPTVVIGMTCLAAGTAALLSIGSDSPAWVMAAVLCVRGFSGGFVIQPLLTALLAGLSGQEADEFSTIFRMLTGLAGSVGVSIFVTIFGTRMRDNIAAGATVAATQAFREATIGLVAVAVLGLALSFALTAELAPRRPS